MNNQELLASFILFAPLVSAVLIQLFWRKKGCAKFSVGVVCLTFAAAAMVFIGPDFTQPDGIQWLDFGPAFRAPIGLAIEHAIVEKLKNVLSNRNAGHDWLDAGPASI